MGMRFAYPHVDVPGNAHRLQRHAGRARGEVIGNAEDVFHLDSRFPARRKGDVDGIRQRNGLKDGTQLMGSRRAACRARGDRD